VQGLELAIREHSLGNAAALGDNATLPLVFELLESRRTQTHLVALRNRLVRFSCDRIIRIETKNCCELKHAAVHITACGDNHPGLTTATRELMHLSVEHRKSS